MHDKTGAKFPFDENSLGFPWARFIISRLQARYNCYSGGFILLRFTCRGRKTRPLNVARVSLRQNRIKGSVLREVQVVDKATDFDRNPCPCNSVSTLILQWYFIAKHSWRKWNWLIISSRLFKSGRLTESIVNNASIICSEIYAARRL